MAMFSAVKQLAKGTEIMAYKMILIHTELWTLWKANKALAKRQRAKQTHLQAGGALTAEDAQALIATKATSGQESGEGSSGGGMSEAGSATQRRCGSCGKRGHNIRTCQEVEETSEEGSCIECY